jgi:predicted O-methyltransferase YrrM
MYLISHVRGRNNFGVLLSMLGLNRFAVEVGTHRGQFAADFLSRVLKVYGDRVNLMRSTSAIAVMKFADSSLDFVYLDGDHTRPGIDYDLTTWWPKLRRGGLLAGHDIITSEPPNAPDEWGRYIQPAVEEFARREFRRIYLVVEECKAPWSYYLIKP